MSRERRSAPPPVAGGTIPLGLAIAALLLLSAPGGGRDESGGDTRPPGAEPTTGDPVTSARRALEEGRPAEALQGLLARAPSSTTESEARYLLVDALLALDDVAGAEAAAERARNEAPDHPLTFVALADVLLRRGELGGAERFYREAVRRDGSLARGHLGLGRLWRSQGLRRSAADSYRRARELAPADSAALLALASLTPDPTERLRLTREARHLVRDPELGRHLDDVLPLLEALGDRAPCRPAADLASAVLPMPELDFHQRSLQGVVGDGRPVPFLLDTGASGLLFDLKLAAKAGIDQLTSGDLAGIGDWGSLRGASGIAPVVSFGTVRFETCPVRIADTRFRIGERGVVGADLFADFLLQFDFEDNRLHLDRLPSPPGANGLPVLADRAIGPQHAGWTPVRLWQGALLVETEVNRERTAWFVLDTGAQFNLLDSSLAADLVQLKRYTAIGVRGFSGPVSELYQAQQRVTLTFAGIEQGNDGMLAMDLSPLSSALGLEIGGILGYELLRHLDLAIDYRNVLVRLRPR